MGAGRSSQSGSGSHRPWPLLSVQDEPPYHHKAFGVRISFPRDYPLKPPTVAFTTKIYHPNVDENGQVCLPIISKGNWEPTTKAFQGRLGLELRAKLGAGAGDWTEVDCGCQWFYFEPEKA